MDTNTNSGNARDLTKKKVRNLLGGAALAVGLILGGGAVLPNISHAQTTTTTAAASQSDQATTTAASQTSPATNTQPANPGNNAPPSFQPGDNNGFGGRGGPGHGPGNMMGGPGGKGGPGRGGLSGVITAVSGDTITLKQANSIVITATVNSSTVYSEAGKTIALSDLKAGETVALRESRNSDGTVNVAGVDVVLNHANGSISAINGNTLTVTRRDGSTIKVNVDSSTSYQDLGKSSSLASLKVGSKLDAAGMLNSDGSINAQVINVQHDHLGGTVTAINGNTITVQVGRGPNGNAGKGPRGGAANGTNGTNSTTTPTATTTTTRTITVSGDTSYLEAGQAAQLSNIAVGDQIDAAGTVSSDGNTIQALQVSIHLPSYRGQVTAVSGSTITLQDRRGTRTIEVNSSTKYLNGTASAALSDVKTGTNLEAQGTVDSSGKMTATVVQVGQPQPGQPQQPRN